MASFIVFVKHMKDFGNMVNLMVREKLLKGIKYNIRYGIMVKSFDKIMIMK